MTAIIDHCAGRFMYRGKMALYGCLKKRGKLRIIVKSRKLNVIGRFLDYVTLVILVLRYKIGKTRISKKKRVLMRDVLVYKTSYLEFRVKKIDDMFYLYFWNVCVPLPEKEFRKIHQIMSRLL